MPELRTERTVLRGLSLSDVDDVYSYARDPEWARYLPVPQPYSRKDAVTFISLMLTSDSTEIPFAIVINGHVAGGISVRPDAATSVAEIGYSLRREEWGRGIMTEVARHVTAWAFDSLELERVYARVDPRNTGSWRVMEKLGMRREAHLRQHAVIHGERCDELWYGILRSEHTSPPGWQ